MKGPYRSERGEDRIFSRTKRIETKKINYVLFVFKHASLQLFVTYCNFKKVISIRFLLKKKVYIIYLVVNLKLADFLSGFSNLLSDYCTVSLNLNYH